MEGQRHNNPLNLRCFVYNGPKGMELAPNPSYSGGSISAHHLLCNFIIFNILPCFLLFMYASYYTGLFCMSCIMFMCLLYMCITVLLFWRKKRNNNYTHTYASIIHTCLYASYYNFIKTQPIVLTLLTFWSLSETFIRGRNFFLWRRSLIETEMSTMSEQFGCVLIWDIH